MLVAVERRGGTRVVRVDGEIDDYNAKPLHDQLLRVIQDDGCRGVVVDLADCELLTAAGLSVLVDVAKRLQAHDLPLIVARPNPHVGKVIELTRLDVVLGVQRDLDAALTSAVAARLARD